MFRLLAVIALCGLCFSAHAATYTTKSTGCPGAVSHVPDTDVTYKAGESEEGWAVAPADVAPPALSAEDFQNVQVPLRFPNPAGAHNPHGPDYSESFLEPGTVTVDTTTGTTQFNDKDITPLDPSQLDPECWE